eukprot:scaffold64926_cov60-Phaeocystis_antarctica.AAC.3
MGGYGCPLQNRNSAHRQFKPIHHCRFRVVRVADRFLRAERRRAGELGCDAPQSLAQAGEQLERGKGVRLRLAGLVDLEV